MLKRWEIAVQDRPNLTIWSLLLTMRLWSCPPTKRLSKRRWLQISSTDLTPIRNISIIHWDLPMDTIHATEDSTLWLPSTTRLVTPLTIPTPPSWLWEPTFIFLPHFWVRFNIYSYKPCLHNALQCFYALFLNINDWDMGGSPLFILVPIARALWLITYRLLLITCSLLWLNNLIDEGCPRNLSS